jgi:serine/threonine protein kinase
MLLEYNKYGSAPDMWAIGVLIFTTLCGGKYPWEGESSWETLVGITRFVGKQVVLDLAKQYGTEIPDEIAQQIHGIEEKKFSECFSRNMGHLMDPKLIDLMERLLAVKIEERPGADAALAHPFFST